MKIKKVLFLIILLILIPINVFARDGETSKLYINIDVLEDGSIYVKELAKLQGTYNGRLRSIIYQNLNTPTFIGKESDFNGSDIYNGSDITDLKIYDINSTNPTFNDIFDISKRGAEYQETSLGENGDIGIYNKTTLYNGVDLKIFNPSTSKKMFYMEYKIPNVVVVHNDTAEIAWNILGEEYNDNIYYMEVHVNLPGKDDDERIWLHGPLNGEIKRKENHDGAIINYNFIGARNPVSFRIMFDKNLVPYSQKFSGVDAKEKILTVEKKATDLANAERSRLRKKVATVKVITIIWYIALIITLIAFYIKKKKSSKVDFNQKYLRDFPADYGPEIVSYLLRNKIDENALSASILMIISKKALNVNRIPNQKDDYELIKQEENINSLTNLEQRVMEMLIDIIGDGTKVKLSEIKKYGKTTKNARKFIKEYNDWQSETLKEAKQEEFFMPFVKEKLFLFIISFIGFYISFLNASNETRFGIGYLAALVSIVTLIIIMSTKLKTKKGTEHYKKWMALKNFMIDFGLMDEKELPEIKLWEKYLVYATALGIADKLEKTMRIKIQNMNLTENDLATYYIFNNYTDNLSITNSLSSSINSSISSAVASSTSSIVASSSSSSGGFGGGASSGGGSFGGGGGGGHF
mgnify:CR=1 FL=1